ncbi:hypothetical protein SAMD00019534_052320 [Acytostelium subglobosum LB1]|uniref:hypothetical protein n=1 Tax=Acytostelium subglobosum LB1 TaxID=1410327 RepID=UPI000644D50C|nr:hypothetical protein SAMD00019534_052320 [Acytostelium subglobosum LB1]GAM22057.1 hypothetical protein SAMD00019534_052320 [Acytostelium subglobosum LB1]|eukprot:XP_012755157.1 hypothetical protein SAMD00019534_052320 [Acytostelium subglobosum LB1]
MTSIEKLLVQGIRSFNPDECTVIDFYKPLTLIVGANGAGKTTIIECLKYASTGEMPPNCANGQAFIHDPKIAGSAEVKAQIKMRFKNPHGKPIVATRALCLIQKAMNKQEYRQLDASLQSFNADGQKVSKSLRCGDLDKEIPELMGVSKPVLKNVIFCHQEESNWPLSESAKLKVKFDEIFNAVRYTKALKSTKDKRKDITALLKEQKLKLEVVSTNRDHATRISKEIATMEDNLKKLKDFVKQMAAQLKEKRAQHDTIGAAMKQIETASIELKTMESRKMEIERSKDRLYNSLQEVFEEPDEELIFMGKSFNDEMETMTKAEADLTENLVKLQTEKEALSTRKNKISIEIGKLEQLMKQVEQLQSNRDKQAADLLDRYKLQFDKDTQSPAELIDVLNVKLEEISAAIKSTQTSFQTRIDQCDGEVQSNIAQRQKLEERLYQYQLQIDANNKKLDALKMEAKKVQSLSERASEFLQAIDRAEREIEALEAKHSSVDYEQQIAKSIKQREDIEASMTSMRDLIKVANTQSSARTKLAVKKNDLSKRHATHDAALNDNRQLISELFEGEPDIDMHKLRDHVHARIEQLDSERNEKNEEHTDITHQISQIESELKMVQQERNNKQAQVKALEKKLSDLDEKDRTDLASIIEQLAHNLHQLERSHTILESEDVLYKEYIDKAHSESECGLCKRSMAGDEMDEFVQRLKTHTDDLPTKLDEITTNIQTTRDRLKRLSEAKPHNDQLIQLTQVDIVALIKREKEINQSMSDNLQPMKKELSQQLSVLDQKLKMAAKLAVVASSQSTLLNEITQLEKDIAAEEKSLGGGSSADTRSAEQLNHEYDTMVQQYNSIRSDIERLEAELKKYRAELYTHQQAILSCRENISAEKGSTEILERIRQSEKELLATVDQLRQTVSSINVELDTLKQQFTTDNEQLQLLRSQLEAKSSALTKEKTLFSNKLVTLRNIQTQIPQDADQHKLKLEQLLEENIGIDTQIKNINEDYSKGSGHIDSIRSNLAQRDIYKRTINDNIQYRQLKNNCDTLNAQIAKKKAAVAAVISPEDQATHKTLAEEISNLKTRVDKASGQVEANEQHIKSSQAELNKPTYKDIDVTYRDMIIYAEVLDQTGKDLDKYYRALDKALMKYHVLKMLEINRSIRELWTSTYRGNDIDTIEIRSEESTAANKTINYRVVMVKGDVELDMRGRCSAGQKVLACLIIRLALAENFCTNCGILALDEPTSHLDRANIESFANALLNIIEAKKSHAGFQLIIITHDEEFVQYLSRGNYADYVWKVTKDANQHSAVEKKEISKM